MLFASDQRNSEQNLVVSQKSAPTNESVSDNLKSAPAKNPITYTPAVADAAQCPWTQGRRTRWWLVAVADVLSVAIIAAFTAAALHENSQIFVLMTRGLLAVAVGWLVGWLVTRGHDHLEAVGGGSLVVIVVTWLLWVSTQILTSQIAGAHFALILAVFLLIGQGGWRWIYGFVKAQESIVPRAIQRKIAEQEELKP